MSKLNNEQIVGIFNVKNAFRSGYSQIFFDYFFNCHKNGRYKDYGSSGENCEICDSDKSCDYESCSRSDVIRYPLSDNTSCFMAKAPKGYSSIVNNGQYIRCKDLSCSKCTDQDICESCVIVLLQ